MNQNDRLAIVAAIKVLEGPSTSETDKEAAQGLRDLLSASRALLRAKPAKPWGVMLVSETATTHDVIKYGFVAAVDWLDAERVAEAHWLPSPDHEVVLTYDLKTFHYWLDKWGVKPDVFDASLPQVAP